MSLADVMQPAIRLAEERFVVAHDLERVLKVYEQRLKQWPVSAAIFYKEEDFYEADDTLIQTDLACSLK